VEVRRSSISMQEWWAGRARGTACAQREPETFKGRPGHECSVNTNKCCSFSPADLLDSTAALSENQRSSTSCSEARALGGMVGARY